MKKVNKWKRLAALGVSAMMIFSTVACGSDSKEGSKTDDGDVKKSTCLLYTSLYHIRLN